MYASSELMDRNANAFWWELLKNSFGIGIVLYTSDWFGVSEFLPWLLPLVVSYFIISSVVVYLFCRDIQSTTRRAAIA